MYEKLPLDYITLTDGFGSRKDPISGTTSYHYGIDLGWKKTIGAPIYAIYDSKVVYEGYDSNLGNHIVLTYDKDEKTIIYRFFHMRDRAIVKKGATVKRNTTIGYMGTTGYSTGVHLHFEYWVCPKGYIYNVSDRPKYAKDPFLYCYLFEDQEVSSDTLSYVQKVVGTSLKKEKDETKNQIEVYGDLLRCRTDGSLNASVLGYIDYGIYDILDEKTSDNYTWYKIDNNKWIANVSDSVKVYKINNNNEENPLPEEENLNLKNYESFKAEKDGYYYIYLKENEIIYYPKKNI